MTFPFTFSCIPMLGQSAGEGFILLSNGDKLVADDGYGFYLVEKGSSLNFESMQSSVVPVLDNNKPILVTKNGTDYIVSLVNVRSILIPTLLGQRAPVVKSFNTSYFNNSGYTTKVSVVGSFSSVAGTLRAFCDTNSTPTLQIASSSAQNSSWVVSITVLVPNLHYYRIASDGGTATSISWSEMPFFGG